MIFDLIEFEKNNKSICNGDIYYCKESTFIDNRGDIIYQKRMVHKKRLSCKGNCDQYHIIEDLSDHIDCDAYDDSNCVNGKYYQAVVVNESRDVESGQIDDWDLGFIEYKT